MVLLVSMSLQYIEHKVFLSYEYATNDGFNLDINQSLKQYGKFSIIPLIMYFPLSFALLKNLGTIWCIRITLGISILIIPIENLILSNFGASTELRLQVFTLMQSLIKSLQTTALFTLFLIGLRLQPIIQNRPSIVHINFIMINCGCMLGSGLGIAIVFHSLRNQIPKSIDVISQITMPLIAFLISLTFNSGNEQMLRSTSSADVLNSGINRNKESVKQTS